jgi:hypothetical protein
MKFEEVIARLYTLTKNNYNMFDEGDKYKTSFLIIGTFQGEVFTLYDYKADNNVHIGGNSNLNVNDLTIELVKLIEITQPTNFTAEYYYDEFSGKKYEY